MSSDKKRSTQKLLVGADSMFVKKSATYGTKHINGKYIDLSLPKDKTPMDLDAYRQGDVWTYFTKSSLGEKPTDEKVEEKRNIPFGKASQFIEEAVKKEEAKKSRQQLDPFGMLTPASKGKNIRTDVGTKTVALGSEENIFFTENLGLFAAIIEAYNHHWNLRVSPDDFWFPVIRKIASLIDENSSKDKVRKHFVNHEGKKEIVIKVPQTSIYDVDYPWLFQQFSTKLEENIKIPDYATTIQADFTTSSPELQVVSSITLMSSLQEYFEYTMQTMCGIKGIEMLGDLEDWQKLKKKFEAIMKILQPIEEELVGVKGKGLKDWSSKVKIIFEKLVSTYQGKPDTDWWSKIMHHEKRYGSGGGTFYSGWIVEFLQGYPRENGLSKFNSGLCTVPMKIEDDFGNEDMSTLVAGMLGFTVDDGNETSNGIPSVRPFQGWALMLPPESPFRKDRN